MTLTPMRPASVLRLLAPLGMAAACDYTSGDFYGGKYQHIIGTKVLAAASKAMRLLSGGVGVCMRTRRGAASPL